MWLRAAEQEKAVPSIWMPCEELAPWPVKVPASVGPQPHLGPLLGEHEELFRDYLRESRRREIAGQVAQGARGRPASIDPASKRHDHRRQAGDRLAVELYIVHAHPLGIGQ
jgi:hypothetical protein